MIPRLYVALGDSFSGGWDAPQAIEPWPDVVARTLGIPAFRNLAREGATSEQVESNQLPEAIALGPDLVTLVCGANDVLGSFRPDLDAYELRLDRMLARLARELPDAHAFTATTPNFGRQLRLRERSLRRVHDGMEELNAITRRVAGKRGVPCLPIAEHPLARSPSSFGPDGVHPSRQGRDVTAHFVAEDLRERLAAAGSPA